MALEKEFQFLNKPPDDRNREVLMTEED